MISANPKKLGFTLIEILIVVFLVALLVPVLVNIYIATNVTSKVNSAQIRLQIEGRRSMDTMVGLVRQAKQAVSNSNGYQADNTTLITKLSSIDANQNLLATDDIIVFDYDAANKRLKQHVFPASGSVRPSGLKTIANDVDSISFDYLDTTDSLLCVFLSQETTRPRKWWEPTPVYALPTCTDGFDYTPTAKVKITMTLKKPIGNREAKVTLTDEVRLRNK